MAILNPDHIYNWNGVIIKEYLLTTHNPNKIDMPTAKLPATPKGVTIHNTPAISVSSNTSAAEQYTRATVNGNMKTTRVHFYVDDICAWQNLPLDLSGWHAADGNGDGNRKTIAIEVIGDSKKAEQNAIKLAAYLLKKFNLNVNDNLFTHTYWLNVKDGKKGSIDELNIKPHVYKCCPAYILPHWSQFKEEVGKLVGAPASTPASIPSAPQTLYRIRKSWADDKSQIGAFASLDGAKAACKEGYKVYDNNGKEVYSKPLPQQETKPAPTPAKTPVPAAEKIDIFYRSFATKWLGEIKNYNTTDGNGYSGIERKAIRGFSAKAAKGNIKYRVHIQGGGWLNWITKYNPNNWVDGCAGIKTKDIDALQMELVDCPGYQVRYRVSTLASNDYLPWVAGVSDYAGIFGKGIDKIQAEIIKL